MPEEVRAAKRINQEGERIIDKAQEEAERIVARAQEQAAYLIDERGLTEAAEDESRRIIAAAEDEAAQVRQGADDYASGVLAALEGEVTRTLRGIERGIAMLDERRAAIRTRAGARGRGRRLRAGRATTTSTSKRGPRPPPTDERSGRATPPRGHARRPADLRPVRADGRAAGHGPRLRRGPASTSTRATACGSPSRSRARSGCRAPTAGCSWTPASTPRWRGSARAVSGPS